MSRRKPYCSMGTKLAGSCLISTLPGRCMATLVSRFVSFFFPSGLVFFTAIGFLRPQGLPHWLQPPVAALPYVVLGFGLIFGWYLASARLLLSLLILTLAEQAVRLVPAFGANATPTGQTLLAMTAFLVPLNFLAFSLFKEESLSTVRGILRVLLVMAQPFVVLWLCYPGREDIAKAFQDPFIPGFSTDAIALPQPALIAFAAAILLHVTRYVLHREPLEAGSAWALASVFVAYHGAQFGWQATNFFSAAGLIMFIAFVQSSHQRTYRDELTGIAGRLAYEEASAQLGKQFSIAVIAVDQLKTYGSVHGKSVSEQVLKLVAPAVQASIGSGRVFRVSGEELTVLFPHQSATDTIVALDAARKAVEQMALFLRGRDRVWRDTRGTHTAGKKDRELPITLSIGVAEKAGEAATLSLAIKAAYRALYDAKGAGGNVVKRGVVTTDVPRRSYGTTGRIVAHSEY